MTPQRTAVVAVLDGAHGHFSAEDVHAAVQTPDSPISLATVYNTLSALVALGELGEVRDGRRPTRFDPTIAPHHHLLCDGCGALIDIDPVDLCVAAAPIAQRHDFVVESVDVIIRGRCGTCSRTAGVRSS